MTKLAVTTANTCVGVYADSEADKAEGAAESGANRAEVLDADWDEQLSPSALRPLHTNRPPPSRAHKSASALHKPALPIPRAPALPRELRPPIAASRRDLTTARPSSNKRSEPRKRRLSPPKKPSQPAPSTAEATRPTRPSPAATPSKTAKPTAATRGSASIPPRPVSVAPRPTSKSVPPPAPSAHVEEKQSALSKHSVRPLAPSQRSKPPETKPSVDRAAVSENEPIPLANPRPAKPQNTFSETPSLAASYVASLGSSVPPTQPSAGTVGLDVEVAADRGDHSRKEPSAATRVATLPDEPPDSVEQTHIAVPRPALALGAEPEPLDADFDGEDTEVVDRNTILASRRQAQEASEAVPPSEPPEETLLPPSTPTAASGQAMEHIRREASVAETPPAADEHPPPATETDAPVAMDLTPASTPAPADADADLFLASLGRAGGALRSPRGRWVAGAGAVVIGVAALVMLSSESSDAGDAEAAATLPAAAEQVAKPQPNQPEAKPSPPAAAEEPEPAETSEPAPLAIRTVAVQVYPADAVIFSGGERLGKGTVAIRLSEGEQKVILVKRAGYASRQVSLDGAASEVNVALVKQGAVDAIDETSVEKAEPEAPPLAEPAAPDPLAVSVPTRDDPYASVPGPESEPAKAKPGTPARDDPFTAVPAGKSAPGRWEENPGF